MSIISHKKWNILQFSLFNLFINVFFQVVYEHLGDLLAVLITLDEIINNHGSLKNTGLSTRGMYVKDI